MSLQTDELTKVKYHLRQVPGVYGEEGGPFRPETQLSLMITQK